MISYIMDTLYSEIQQNLATMYRFEKKKIYINLGTYLPLVGVD